jgi:putative intracellular protease/amidase
VHPTMGAVLVAMLDTSRKIVAAVCHGPAGFFTASRADGTWAFKDRQITGFSNEEETQAGFGGNAPWLLGPSAYFWRTLYRKSALDAARPRRRQSRHRAAELLCRRHGRCCAETARGYRLSC